MRTTTPQKAHFNQPQRNQEIEQFWDNIYTLRFTHKIETKKVVDQVGTKRAIVLTSGSEKKRCTVVLTCGSDGTLFAPMIIFKGKQTRHKSVDKVLSKIHPLDTKLLVLDAFSGHKDKQDALPLVARRLKKNDFHTLVVPGGCTPLVQPLDVALIRPFKARVKELWASWVSDQIEKSLREANERTTVEPLDRKRLESNKKRSCCQCVFVHRNFKRTRWLGGR